MKILTDREKRLIPLIAGILLVSSLISTFAFYESSHTLYVNKTSPVDFCTKCHTVKAAVLAGSAHQDAGCICHGYNPNLTAEYNINVAHNITKQIYCTNCHTNYDDSGNILIHTAPVYAPNQSAHYIMGSSNNKSKVYSNARQFFEGR